MKRLAAPLIALTFVATGPVSAQSSREHDPYGWNQAEGRSSRLGNMIGLALAVAFGLWLVVPSRKRK